MSQFAFHTLALIVLVGMAGPLLVAVPGLRIPLVLGELVAGIVIGRTGFGIVDTNDPTFTLLANIGFALVMFVVGTHVSVRDPSLRSGFPRAIVRAVLVGVVASVLGVLLATVFGTGHAALYAVLMASSSAAIAGCAGGSFVILRWYERQGTRKRLQAYSKKHRLALELRFSLLMLFGLAAVATSTHASIMLARFALGLVVNGVIAVLAHCAGRVVKQPLAPGAMAAAQLGVPVAAAALGTELELLSPGEPSALILGALLTIAATTIAGVAHARRQPVEATRR